MYLKSVRNNIKFTLEISEYLSMLFFTVPKYEEYC